MGEEDIEKPEWRYFGRDSMLGTVYEIYRCPANGKRLEMQRHEDVYLLLDDGSWRSNMLGRISREIHNGDFSEKCDEISEEEVAKYYESWRAGEWPGKHKA